MESGPCSDVCAIGDYDGDAPAFYDEKIVKGRKVYHCCECGEKIDVGQQHWSIRGKWDSGILSFRMCLLCHEIAAKYACGGYAFESVWEQLEENLFPTMKTGCLEGLSVEAKHKMVDAWREWKGLAPAT